MKAEEYNTFIKPSPIHGLGLFATVDIAKGDIIVQGKENWAFIDEWIQYNKTEKVTSLALVTNSCMVNHADNPNTFRDADYKIIASKNIKAGAEITEDYNKLPDIDNPFIVHGLASIIYEGVTGKTLSK